MSLRIAFSEDDRSRIALCDGDCVMIEGTPQQLLKVSRWDFLNGVCRAAIENQAHKRSNSRWERTEHQH